MGRAEQSKLIGSGAELDVGRKLYPQPHLQVTICKRQGTRPARLEAKVAGDTRHIATTTHGPLQVASYELQI